MKQDINKQSVISIMRLINSELLHHLIFLSGYVLGIIKKILIKPNFEKGYTKICIQF